MDTNRIHIGIDIGSTCTKAVVMDKGGIAYKLIMPTGWSSVDTAQSVKQNIEANMGMMENASITATGYGRISVPYAGKTVTEITCHAKGACYLYNAADLSVIDIGGQDTKIITIERGAVTDFMMNDKCSAGTGRFLDIMAGTLGVRLDELCELARQSENHVSISSMCTVFAESEAVSLIGRGTNKEDIAYGIVDSIASKVWGQLGRLRVNGGDFYLSGGLCELPFILEMLSEKIGTSVKSAPLARYAGAIGAALYAQNMK